MTGRVCRELPEGTNPIAHVRVRRAGPVLAVAAALAVSACSASTANSGVSVSVFTVKPGQCFVSPKQVKAQLSSLTRTPCSRPHNQEAYASVPYATTDGSTASAYPGDSLLGQFAQGACAQKFTSYVGTDYLDSSLYFTYLVPSPLSWESNDRNILCFVTTAGQTLTASVKDSKK